MSVLVGLDIGGTKCAVSIGQEDQGGLRLLAREEIPTPREQTVAMDQLCTLAARLLNSAVPVGIGISAGGPLDAAKGVLHNPPNLPGWKDVSLTAFATQRLHAPAALENDANACALAEWRWGAGKGSHTMAFLTFGTGLGCGIVLDGQLLRGATGDAGEVGHWRLSGQGPAGYGKIGSFEGFCSGGGLRQLATTIAERERQAGRVPAYANGEPISARTVAQAALAGDAAAREVFSECGEWLGRGLALLIDFLNPDRIVIGSIYTRSQALLEPSMRAVLAREALPRALDACSIVAAQLGDRIGDYAALALAAKAAG